MVLWCRNWKRTFDFAVREPKDENNIKEAMAWKKSYAAYIDFVHEEIWQISLEMIKIKLLQV